MRVHRFDNALRPLSWLPNKEGFRFIGVRADKTEVECHVELGPDKLHRIADRMLLELIGWKPLPLKRDEKA